MSQKNSSLNKRIPRNPKYEHVKSTIDTGASLSKYLNKIEELKTNYKFSKDEIFKRMKITTFVHLIVQVQRITLDEDFVIPDTPCSMATGRDCEPNCGDGSPTESNRELPPGNLESQRSTLLSVSQGIGELDKKPNNGAHNNQHSNANGDQVSGITKSMLSPYLLLDIREKEEYDQCHIITALNYPKAILSRSVNYESKEMLTFKNKEGKIIVVYDEDEKISGIVATTLVQRRYDNIFMLSGGLKVAHKMFPEGLIDGTLPPSVTGAKPKKQNSVVMATKSTFTWDDIDKIEIYLNNYLQTTDNSSRMSQTAGSSRMSVRSSASNPSDGRPVFKP